MPYTVIPDVLSLDPKEFGDRRGFFFESFNQQDFNKGTGLDVNFVQDNHSRSAKGVLRGLYYQLQQAQDKLVRVVRGAVFDVALDIRKSSQTFGQRVGCELTEDNHRQFWVSPALPKALWRSAKPQTSCSCTKPPTITLPRTSAALPGATQPSASPRLKV